MADLLHPTRLRWSERTGRARHDGVQVELTARPEIPGLPFVELDYTPGCCAQIRPTAADAMRDMEGRECAAVLLWLEQRAAACRGIFEARKC